MTDVVVVLPRGFLVIAIFQVNYWNLPEALHRLNGYFNGLRTL